MKSRMSAFFHKDSLQYQNVIWYDK